MATFCSEIRKVSSGEAKPAQTTQQPKKRSWPSEQNDLPDWIKEEVAKRAAEAPAE